MTYENEHGETVYTSLYLKNKKTCCRSKCLHCPYGFTLKQEGLQFREVDTKDIDQVKTLIGDEKKDEFNVASSLLGSAFGVPKKSETISSDNYTQFKFVLLKGQICGVVKVGNLQASGLYLKSYFKDQGITLDMVNSYL